MVCMADGGYVVDVVANAMETVRVVGGPASIPFPDADRARASDSCQAQSGFQRRCLLPDRRGNTRIFHGGFGHQAGQEVEEHVALSFCNIGHHWPLAKIMNFRLR